MKKLVYVSAVCLLLAGMSGCNLSWPRCFCNQDDAYVPMESCDPCDACAGAYPSYEGYYMPGASDVQWVPQSGSTTIDSLPTPGPEPSST
jgi:hypothetical protein